MTTALTTQDLRKTTTPGRHKVGDGLFLLISKNGTKSWVQRLRINGRPADRGLGKFPEVGVREAKQLADLNRLDVLTGHDPRRYGVPPSSPTPTAPRVVPRVGRPPAPPTLEKVAKEFHAVNLPHWKNAKVAANWMLRFNKHISPKYGQRPVNTLTVVELRDELLRPIANTKPETGKRLRIILKQTLEYAVESEWLSENIIDKIPLRRLKSEGQPKAKHLAALPYQNITSAMIQIRESTSWRITKEALRFLVLTGSRSHMVRFATWGEVCWSTKTWEVPAEKMKMDRPHRIPLSEQAILILNIEWSRQRQERVRPAGDALIFPSPDRGPLSDNTFSQLMRRLGLATPHGFRSSLRTWMVECTDASWAVAESALAHSVGTSVEQAYMRSDLLELRRPIMQLWADWLTPADERSPF